MNKSRGPAAGPSPSDRDQLKGHAPQRQHEHSREDLRHQAKALATRVTEGDLLSVPELYPHTEGLWAELVKQQATCGQAGG